MFTIRVCRVDGRFVQFLILSPVNSSKFYMTPLVPRFYHRLCGRSQEQHRFPLKASLHVFLFHSLYSFFRISCTSSCRRRIARLGQSGNSSQQLHDLFIATCM